MDPNKKLDFDKRTFGRYMEKGQLKVAELNSHLKSLPDDQANAQWVQIDLHDSELPDGMAEDEGMEDAN